MFSSFVHFTSLDIENVGQDMKTQKKPSLKMHPYDATSTDTHTGWESQPPLHF